MKRLIAGVILATVFLCGVFASYAADEGSLVKSELVKKSVDLAVAEPATVIEMDAPATMPLNRIHAEVNATGNRYQVIPTVNAPPSERENSPHESTRIRAVTI